MISMITALERLVTVSMTTNLNSYIIICMIGGLKS